MKNIAILGSTGSIGVNTLDVIKRHPHRFQVVALTAHCNVERLLEQCIYYKPRYVAMSDPRAAEKLRHQLHASSLKIEVLAGAEAVAEIAALPEVDTVMAAIVGAAGLLPTLAAVRAGKQVLLANKEALVMAGSLLMDEVKRCGASLLPIDSEHNAVFQCLPQQFLVGEKPIGVSRITITASGGAFRATPLAKLKQVTPEQACSHPTWNMGPKITVDCATMMNKGLEVIEAHYLFDLAADTIQTILHPQSMVHSLVDYQDGSTLAHLGNPDMRVPIAYALAWPERIDSGVRTLDLSMLGQLDFAPMDNERYPSLALAYAALQMGGSASAHLNAANEVAVDAFLRKQILFTDIYRINAKVLESLVSGPVTSLEAVLEEDASARKFASQLIERYTFSTPV